MIKLFSKLCILYIFAVSPYAYSSLLVDCASLSNDTCSYITHEYNGVEYDVAWASSVNSERWYFSGVNGELAYNELYAPTIFTGWNFAGTNDLPELLDIFSDKTGEGLLKLFKPNEIYVHAFEFWNSEYVTVDTSLNLLGGISGEEDLVNKNIKSSWSWDGATKPFDLMTSTEKTAEAISIMMAAGFTSHDTFYVRKRLTNDSTPVPEPSTLMIFALGLIALVSKKKLFS